VSVSGESNGLLPIFSNGSIDISSIQVDFNNNSSSSRNAQKNVCLIEESPFYIHKIAQTERLEELKRLYNEDPSRLFLKDNTKNWLPIQYAASKSKTKIIDFIVEKTYSGKCGFYFKRTIKLRLTFLTLNNDIIFYRYS
jgi:hypothetical protein